MKQKNLFTITGIFIFLIGFVSADEGGCFGGMMFGTGMWPFMWVLWIFVLISLVLFIVWLIKQIQKK